MLSLPGSLHGAALRGAFRPVWSLQRSPIDDGCSSDRRGGRLLRLLFCLYARLRQAVREAAMLFDYVFGGAVTVFLAIYLTYALIRPERF